MLSAQLSRQASCTHTCTHASHLRVPNEHAHIRKVHVPTENALRFAVRQQGEHEKVHFRPPTPLSKDTSQPAQEMTSLTYAQAGELAHPANLPTAARNGHKYAHHIQPYIRNPTANAFRFAARKSGEQTVHLRPQTPPIQAESQLVPIKERLPGEHGHPTRP